MRQQTEMIRTRDGHCWADRGGWLSLPAKRAAERNEQLELRKLDQLVGRILRRQRTLPRDVADELEVTQGRFLGMLFSVAQEGSVPAVAPGAHGAMP